MSRPAKRAEAYRSEPDINSRGKTEVVLAGIKKIRVYLIALKAHRQSMNQPVIDSAA
jgi:hypothetical protein